MKRRISFDFKFITNLIFKYLLPSFLYDLLLFLYRPSLLCLKSCRSYPSQHSEYEFKNEYPAMTFFFCDTPFIFMRYGNIRIDSI